MKKAVAPPKRTSAEMRMNQNHPGTPVLPCSAGCWALWGWTYPWLEYACLLTAEEDLETLLAARFFLFLRLFLRECTPDRKQAPTAVLRPASDSGWNVFQRK